MLVEADVALVGGDGRGEVDLVVVGVGAGSAVVGRGHQVLEQVGGDARHGHIGWVDGRDAVGLVDGCDALACKIAGEIAVCACRSRAR